MLDVVLGVDVSRAFTAATYWSSSADAAASAVQPARAGCDCANSIEPSITTRPDSFSIDTSRLYAS